MILKLGMQHHGLELYKVCINDDHGLTMTILWQGQRTLVDKAHILGIVLNLCLNVLPLKDIMLVCNKTFKNSSHTRCCHDNSTKSDEIVIFIIFLSFSKLAAAMAKWVRSLYFSALNHSIISPLCLVWVRAPHWPHVRQDKFCLRVCQVVFPGYSRFAPPIDWLVYE